MSFNFTKDEIANIKSKIYLSEDEEKILDMRLLDYSITKISIERGYSNPVIIEKKLWKTSDGKKNRTYITIRACKRSFQFWIDNTDDGICRDFNAMNSVSKEVKKRVGDFIKAHSSELKLA